jgi:hypothetical protein
VTLLPTLVSLIEVDRIADDIVLVPFLFPSRFVPIDSITYVTFSIPGTLLAKATSPSMSIACGCLIWSIAASGMAGAQSFAGVVTCRLFIGIGEALFGQAVAFHYSLWYKKEELGKRLAAFVGFGVIAGAFGGKPAFLVVFLSRLQGSKTD